MEANSARRDAKEKQETNPKKDANCFSLLTFWWVGAILRKGNKTSLNDTDLYPLLEEDKSQRLVEFAEREWKEEVRRCQAKGTKPRLWKCLLRMLPWTDLVLVALLKLLQSATTIALPVMLWFLLGSLPDSPTLDHQAAFGWVSGLCVTALASALSGAHWTYVSDMWGIRLKTATIGLVYKKVSADKESETVSNQV